MPRPFRFGLNSYGKATADEWRDLAHMAEDQGYSTLSISDHTFNPLSPFAALAAAAQWTSRIRIGSYVLANDFRHPTAVASEMATIDLLSGGRLELGIGSGWRKSDYTERGFQFDRPSTRIERLEESVRLIKKLFAGEALTFDGKYYTIDNLVSLPRPVQQPHPPILIGGGARRTLSLAAREADIVSLNLRTTADGGLDFSSVTLEATLEKLRWVREAAGERFADLELNNPVMRVAITDNREATAEEILKGRGLLAETLTVAQLLQSPHFLIGTVDQIVDDLHMRRELYGISYLTLLGGAPNPEDFAPVVARLAGK